jgi:hypothetical protein
VEASVRVESSMTPEVIALIAKQQASYQFILLFMSFGSASFIGHLFLIIIDIFCTYACLAGLYGNI